MPDQNVREIQLGGKQLVFLFMASVVLAVAIFLLGISVGRGVGAPSAETATVTAGEPVPPAPGEMPARTETTPKDNKYHDELTENSAPKPQPAPADEPAKPAAATESTSVPVTPPPAAAGTTRTPSSAAPAPTTAPAAAATTKPSAASARGTTPPAGWYVQVNAFKSRENADKQVSQLKAKGYAATVLADPGSLFRVRIGPFAERTEANSTAERLKREENIGATVGR